MKHDLINLPRDKAPFLMKSLRTSPNRACIAGDNAIKTLAGIFWRFGRLEDKRPDTVPPTIFKEGR